ncbi:unnamed protein product [Caenorhabditis auriculariae]|uniref:Uncharacterized protein n=1 Tax=Caenorhabditis auriculariae TaxID=2777116 RepID=A0A8S1GR92_9PELO|nr:unnamed protein product [Caenorhabditis auriculariae]
MTETVDSSDESRWHSDREDMLMMVMVVLLMLLSVVIWVAFCVAVRKTARKFIELKRARRRQNCFHALIAAAINRVASGNENDRNALPIYIATLAQELNIYEAREEELPSYEQALSMSCTPSPNPVPTSTARLPPYKPRSRKNDRVLRIAPDRPGSVPTIVLPPSYESSVRNESSTSSAGPNNPQRPNSSPIYTISGSVQTTEC